MNMRKEIHHLPNDYTLVLETTECYEPSAFDFENNVLAGRYYSINLYQDYGTEYEVALTGSKGYITEDNRWKEYDTKRANAEFLRIKALAV
jgi:hypothetical protein